MHALSLYPAALDDRGLCLQMSCSDGSCNSVPTARQPDNVMHEEDDALVDRAGASSLSSAFISPDDCLHGRSSDSMLDDVAVAEDRMSESSSSSSMAANMIGSSSCAAAQSQVLASFSPSPLRKEGQGESTCDDHHMWSAGSRKRFNDSAAVEDKLQSPWSRRPYINGATRFGIHTSTKCFCRDIEQDQEYFQQILGSSSYGWTDEKHSSYLDSMEADFLRSVMFRGQAEEPASAHSSELTDSASSHQAAAFREFKVCQNGKWRPMSVPTASYVGPLTHVAVAVKNPWIRRFRSHSKPKVGDPLVQARMSMDSAMRRTVQEMRF